MQTLLPSFTIFSFKNPDAGWFNSSAACTTRGNCWPGVTIACEISSLQSNHLTYAYYIIIDSIKFGYGSFDVWCALPIIWSITETHKLQ